MNVFGGTRTLDKGPRGPRGFRGRDSSIIDFCSWLPNTLLKNLQTHDERGCFFVQNPDKDLVRKGKEITTWISRSLPGLNLDADKPSTEIEKLEDRYVINFDKTRYSTDDLTLFCNIPRSYGFLCVTFRVTTDEDQVLLSDYQQPWAKEMGYCEIKVTANEIILHAHTVTEIIQHSCKNWTTLFIENNSDEEITHYRYNVNGITGSFVAPVRDSGNGGFSLGSRWDDTFFLKGQIASLEMYWMESCTSLPHPVKEVIIRNQNINL